jgi:hypothetical protein
MRRRDEAAWAVLVAVPVAWEFRQLARGDLGVPLSTVIRRLFRTEHPFGAVAFVLAVDLSAGWLKRHILSEAGRTLDA